MSTSTQDVPFSVQPMLSELYYNRDLLDFSGAGRLNFTQAKQDTDCTDASTRVADTPTASGSLLSTATSVAAAAGRRAAAATFPSQQPEAAHSPDNDGPRKEVRCVEGYEKNMYVGRSDGIVEWWVLDATNPKATVSLYQLRPGWDGAHPFTAERLDDETSIYAIPQASCIKDHPATKGLKMLCIVR